MNTDNELRKLAKSSYWQSLYKASKTNNGINLFQNTSNFSGLQMRLWYWLNVYDILYDELMQLEDDLLTEKVILDNDRCDAYLVYRNKKNEYLLKELRLDQKRTEHKERHKNKHKDGNMNLIEVDLRRE